MGKAMGPAGPVQSLAKLQTVFEEEGRRENVRVSDTERKLGVNIRGGEGQGYSSCTKLVWDIACGERNHVHMHAKQTV